MSSLFRAKRPRGATGRPEPGATTNGSGHFTSVAGPPVGDRVPRRVVVVIAGDEVAASRFLDDHHPDDEGAQVLVVTDQDSLTRLAGMRFRRTDRIEWVTGWYQGKAGQALAEILEDCAASGGFGAARHVFAGDV